jgi:hypothetical protein
MLVAALIVGVTPVEVKRPEPSSSGTNTVRILFIF